MKTVTRISKKQYSSLNAARKDAMQYADHEVKLLPNGKYVFKFSVNIPETDFELLGYVDREDMLRSLCDQYQLSAFTVDNYMRSAMELHGGNWPFKIEGILADFTLEADESHKRAQDNATD